MGLSRSASDCRHAAHKANPCLRPARAKGDGALTDQILRIWNGNFQVYGARKDCHLLSNSVKPEKLQLKAPHSLKPPMSGRYFGLWHHDISAAVA